MRKITILPLLITCLASAQFSPRKVIGSTVTNDTVTVAMADMDGDGDQDAVLGGRAFARLEWLKNDGAGNFTPGRTVETGQRIADVVAGDLDADGDVDLVTSIARVNELHVFLNQGSGLFTSDPIVVQSGAPAEDLALQTLAGDAVPDIVVAQKALTRVAAFTGTGNGNFNAAATVLVSGAAFERFLFVDLNGDAQKDLVLAVNTPAPAIERRLYSGGVFGAAAVVPTLSSTIYDVFAKDADADGDVDIAASIGLGFSLSRNSAGTFGAAEVAVAGVSTANGGHRAMLFEDLDADGDNDVLLSVGTVLSFFTNSGPGQFALNCTRALTAAAPFEALSAQVIPGGLAEIVLLYRSNGDVEWLSRTVPPLAVGNAPSIFRQVLGAAVPALLDYDSDGDVDHVFSGSEGLLAMRYDGGGNWQGPLAITRGISGSATFATALDLDANGVKEIIVRNSTYYLILTRASDGKYVERGRITASNYITCAPFLADMDNDGDQDVLLHFYGAARWYRNDGNGTLTAMPSYLTVDVFSNGDFTQLGVADLDGDGDKDVLTTSLYGLYWTACSAPGVFPTTRTLINSTTSGYVLADMDADGDIDIVPNSGSNWFRNSGTGTFTTSSGTGFATDIDGDGDLDMVSVSTGNLSRSLNNGTGTFSSLSSIAISSGSTLITIRDDVDHDGDLDLLLSNSSVTGVFRYLPNIGGGNFSTDGASPYQRSGAAQESNVVDVDEDGQNDLLLRYTGQFTGDAVGWYRKTGSGWATFQNIEQAVSGFTRLADVDLDGKTDIITRSGTVVSWRRNLSGSSFAAASVLNGLTALAETNVFADVNGDGLIDVITFGSPYNVLVAFGTSLGSFGTAQTICTDCQWTGTLQVLDLDGDGDRDITGTKADRWFKNTGANTFTPITFTALTGNITRVFGHDVDHDGRADLVSSSFSDPVWSSISTSGIESTGTAIQGTSSGASFSDVNGDGIDEAMGSGWICNEVAIGRYEPVVESPYLPSYNQRVDADQDGALEYIILYGGRVDYLETTASPMGTKTRTISTQMSSGTGGGAPGVADLDQDGRKDVIYSTTAKVLCFPANSSGGFSSPYLVGLGGNGSRLYRTGDVNNDGKLDVLAVLGQQMGVYMNLGGGQFTEIRMWTDANDGGGPQSADLADMDGDGWLDVVYFELPHGGVSPDRMYWRRNYGGAFGTNSGLFTSTQLGGNTELHLQDLDGDGDRDVIFADAGAVKELENLGGGTFATAVTLFTGWNNEMAFADANADGRLDILYESTAGTQLVINNGGWSFGTAQQVAAGAHGQIAFCDMDLDGDQDLLLMNASLTEVGWNNGAGQFTLQTVLADGGSRCTPVDLDNDGDLDLVTANSSTPSALYWYENLAGSPMIASGRVFRDMNSNGTYDNGEPGVANVAITEQPSNAVAYTDQSGQYIFHLAAGTHKLQVPDSTLFSASTTGGWTRYAGISNAAPISANNNFGVLRPDTMLGAVCVQVQGLVCNATTSFQATVRNNGTVAFNGVLRVKLASNITVLSYVQPPDSVVAGNAYWTITNLQPNADMKVKGTITLPGGQGTVMAIEGAVRVQSVQFPTAVTFQNAYQIATNCSFDPNAKSVMPEGTGTTGNIPPNTTSLTYTIHFQNLGNAPAQNVMVRDRLNAALDRTSVQVLASSFTPEVSVEGDGELVFRFTGINLPDSASNPVASQGYVRFSIDLLPGQPVGTVITNTADIHFDQNAPVTTNETINRLHGGFVQVSPKVLLQGPYDATVHLMRDNLRTRGVIPSTEPYSALGFAGITTAQVQMAADLWNRTGSDAVVDWVLIELRSSANPATVVATRAALVQRDGDVVDVNGSAALYFPVSSGSYRVAVRHRLHLGALSGNAFSLGLSPTAVDLSASNATFYGTQAVTSASDNLKVLWSGDATGNGVIKYTGTANDRDPIILAVGGSTPNNTLNNVYDRRDTNLDGVIKYTGTGNDRDIILTNVGSTTPNSTRTQQLP